MMGSLRTDLERAARASSANAAAGVLRTLFPEAAVHAQSSPLPLAGFQAEAAARILRLLDVRGGALLADSVGLGKTHVAMAVIGESIRRGNGPVLVVTPAALRRQWTGPLGRLARAHGVPFVQPGRMPAPDTGPSVEWTSHTRLSRGDSRERRPAVVVVDEAHAFRNPRTRRYRRLAALCVGSRVLLVTATPVNNSLADLYFLLRLFLGDGDLADLGVADLREFLRPEPSGSGVPFASRGALAALTVRRNRRLLEAEPGGANLRFPAHAGCFAVRYDPATAWGPGGLERLVRLIAALRLEVHDVASGSVPGRGASHLVRAGLLKRLESSVAAFGRSIARLDGFLRACLAGLPFGRLPSGRDLREADPGQLGFAALMRGDLPPGVDGVRLAVSAAADLELVERIATLLRARRGDDPKLGALRRLIGTELAGRSVLVFSEFGDTARAIHRSLAARWPTGLVTGREALLGGGRAPRRRVIEAFAPASNGVRVRDVERLRVLVATDVLSEGLNLQDAGDVVSYDLPWNPIRLVQRAGRIDRPGSPHDAIRIYNFLPDHGLDGMLRLMDRIRSKVAAIHSAGGFDVPSLPASSTGPDLHDLVRRLRANDAKILQDLEVQADQGFRIEERARTIARAGPGSGEPGVPGHPRAPPVLGTLPRPAGEATGWLAVTSNGRVQRFLFVHGDSVSEDRAAALRVLSDAADAEGDPVAGSGHGPVDPAALDSELDPDASGAAAAIDAVTRYLGPRCATRSDGRGVAGRAARLLLRRLGSAPGGPSPEACARADAVLERLRPGLARGSEAAVEAILRDEAARAACCEDLLDRLESVLFRRGRPVPGRPADRQRLVGLFRLRPGTELVLEPGPR